MDVPPGKGAVVEVRSRIDVVQYPDSKILLFAKAPEPGKVKTRLIPTIGEEAAAQLYQQLLVSTVKKVASAGIAPTVLYCAPDTGHPLFQKLASKWDIELKQQHGADLGERMAQATVAALRSGESAVLIGGDCPMLDAGHLQQALRWLYQGSDAVIGPAEDGGYFLLGLKDYNRLLFENIPWGGDRVLALTRDRLQQMSWSWRELEPLWDLDRPEDLQRYQACS